MKRIFLFLLILSIASQAYGTWYGPRMVAIPIIDVSVLDTGADESVLKVVKVMYITHGNACPEDDIGYCFSPYYANGSNDINLISRTNISVNYDGDYNIFLDITKMGEIPEDIKYYDIARKDILDATIKALRENTKNACGHTSADGIRKDNILQDSTISIVGKELYEDLNDYVSPRYLLK